MLQLKNKCKEKNLIIGYMRSTVFTGSQDALFSPEKCDLNSTCVLCAKGKYYFQTYKYPYIFYMKKVTHRVKTTMKLILVAVTTIFWVSTMNKLYYVS